MGMLGRETGRDEIALLLVRLNFVMIMAKKVSTPLAE